MTQTNQWLAKSPTLVRVAPFLVFIAITALQGEMGEAARYWLYLVKTIVGAGMLWAVWPYVTELEWRLSWEAVVAGVLVFAIWVGLDGLYPKLNELGRIIVCPIGSSVGLEAWCAKAPDPAASPWNPNTQFGAGSALAWIFILTRIVGSSLVVPPMEEVFFRSFLYRYIKNPDFEKVPLGAFYAVPFIVTCLFFGFEHYEWLPGILCGVIYQGLVIRKRRLGDAVTAHAITNFLLGVWVVWRNAWNFW
jgi:uncharacterized protein